MVECPYCHSKDVDWGFDSECHPGREVIDTALCLNCNKMWVILYAFSGWEALDD